MTRREWMLEHYPDCVSERHGGTSKEPFKGGCLGCPSDYLGLPGAERCRDPLKHCEICWTREVTVTGEAETAEIISDMKDID